MNIKESPIRLFDRVRQNIRELIPSGEIPVTVERSKSGNNRPDQAPPEFSLPGSGTLLALLVCFSFSGCGAPDPVKIGFLGGLSGRVADLGEAGRNGALLAVEQANANGGLNGRRIELVIHDDGQTPQMAIAAIETMAAEKVEAVIGPMTSAMGEAILPAINRHNLVLISPTITASSLSGKEDLIFKIAPSIKDNTQRIARHLYTRGARRVAAAYDTQNHAYSKDWVRHFQHDFSSLGGDVSTEVSFSSGHEAAYGTTAKKLVSSSPDTLLIVANAVDTVRLTQLARNLGFKGHMAASTWAATENLIQLGGRSVEGMVLTQFFNRDDTSARYTAFRDAYRARFRLDPGFASLAAYDATHATLQALSRRKPKQSVAEAMLTAGPYLGAQEEWDFDRYGDALRHTFVTIVRNANFVVIE